MASINRIILQRTSREWFRALDTAAMTAAEISGDWGKGLGFKSHQSFDFPAHDICQAPFRDDQGDCSRWSARGLRNLLIETGFDPASIRADQWGNRAMALRNLEKPWPPEHKPDSDDLTNDPKFPLVAWAMGQRAEA